MATIVTEKVTEKIESAQFVHRDSMPSTAAPRVKPFERRNIRAPYERSCQSGSSHT